MNKKSFLLLMLFTLCSAFTAVAQIGYQVALLNTATGKPRAGETVNATVTLTNKESTVIYTGTQKATTNDFGILSLTIGDADTFKNVDWSKLPLYISVSVDGVLIGKSQVLSVPVAETAKSLAPAFDLNDLLGTWEWSGSLDLPGTYHQYIKTIVFNKDGSWQARETDNGTLIYSSEGECIIMGNFVYVFLIKENGDSIYGPDWPTLICIKDHVVSGMEPFIHK